MNEPTIREPEEIRTSCAEKLRSVEISPMFRAILACLLDEVWTEPRILRLVNSDHCIRARAEGDVGCDKFIGAEADLIRNIHGVAKAANLDGDELGYLLGRVADLKGAK